MVYKARSSSYTKLWLTSYFEVRAVFFFPLYFLHDNNELGVVDGYFSINFDGDLGDISHDVIIGIQRTWQVGLHLSSKGTIAI